jgi:hypothetical protein
MSEGARDSAMTGAYVRHREAGCGNSRLHTSDPQPTLAHLMGVL